MEFPRISWEEGFGAADDVRVSGEIVAALASRLLRPNANCSRLYFITPTPAPYASAEAAFIAAVAERQGSPNDFRTVALPRRGKTYAFASEQLFRTMLPMAFRMGPPELTFIAANSILTLGATEEAIASFVLALLSDRAGGPAQDAAGMHFDSGDLVEMF